MRQGQTDRLERVIVLPTMSIADCLPILDRAGLGVLLLCDAEGRLRAVLTDGDIRRAILNGVSFTEPCFNIATHDPITALTGISASDALAVMEGSKRHPVNHLPVLDADGCVVDLLLHSDFVGEDEVNLSAVIMAGGFGKRLHPLTSETPKPMLPVGDSPLLELTIDQLRHSGIRRVHVTTHYLPEKITGHFGDGRNFGVELKYVAEDRPLGTAGALGLLDSSDEPLLVMNGDILTRVDFRALLEFHRKHQADITVCSRRYDLKVPYGVIETEGPAVSRIKEKPVMNFLVNAGIYLIEPSVHRSIPKDGGRFDMTDLIQDALQRGLKIVSFPIVEYWLDIGQLKDYLQAQKDLVQGRLAS